jgi:7-keto-8-aminopelargonate synthetase-like enzyme
MLHNFTCYDYLGLSSDARVREAAIAAAGHYGTSASASRPVSGEIPLYHELESRLATFLGAESAVLFVSGHATNVTTLEILFGAGDLVLFDEQSQGGNVVEGALVAGACAMAYPHRDAAALERILAEARPRYRKVLIATEGVFAQSGEAADLAPLVALKKRYHTFLLVDEDNSLGVLGASGAGLCEAAGVDPRDVDIRSGGVNKALASCGGFVAGDRALVDYIKHHATSLIFAVSIAPMSTAAAHAALGVLKAEPERAARVRERAESLRRRLEQAGLDVPARVGGALVPLRLPAPLSAPDVARALASRGLLCEPRPGELLLAVTCAHDDAALDAAASTLRTVLAEPALAQGTAMLTNAEERLDALLVRKNQQRITRRVADLPSTRVVCPQPVPRELYQVAEFPEYKNMVRRLGMVSEDKFLYFRPHDGIVNDTICVRGQRNVNYSSFNYLGLSGHPEVIAAAQRAIATYGTSAGAPPATTGLLAVHRELERTLAEFIGTEDAVVFDAGHNTNVSAVGHLFGKGDLVLHDVLSHNSLVQGALLSGAQRQPFPHNDWEKADHMLASLRSRFRRVGIIIEGIYSQDGDLPDLGRFLEVKRRHDALLFVDEAHSIGVAGPTGRGIAEHAGVDPLEIDILMGTISKALGTSGGYITGSRALVGWTRQASCLRNNIHVSPAVAAAALEAVRVLRREPERVGTLHERAALFLRLARAEGLDTGLSGGSGIIPIMTYSSELAYLMTYALLEQGITVHPFTYPVVPEGAARLRFFVTSDHSEEQIRRTVRELARAARRFRAAEEQAPEQAPAQADGG